MNSSRFAHFNKINHGSNGSDNSMDTQDNNSTSSNDTMVISAGLKFQAPTNTGSFVTAVVNGHDNPCGEQATIIRPPAVANGGREEIVTYDNLNLNKGLQENGSIGSVSFTKEHEVINGWIPGWIPGWNREKSHQSNPVTFPLLNPLKSFSITIRVHSNSRHFSFTVSSTDTVDKLKQLIRGVTGLPPDQQNLIFAGKNLTCGMTLGHYGLKEGDEILLTCRLRGG